MKIKYLISIILILTASGCSKEYSVGKIFVVDETTTNKDLNLSEMAEKLIKKTKNIGIKSTDNSNSTLKITVSEMTVSKDKNKIKNRYSVNLTLTATLKDNSIQIFQSESSSLSEPDVQDTHSQINTLLYNALLKLDYQCSIRKYKEEELFKLFEDKRLTRWQKETIIDEIGSRLSSGLIVNYEGIWKFLYSIFLKDNKQYGEKILGILSSADFSKFNLSEERKSNLAEALINYSIGKEAHIQMHTISILAKLNNEISRAYIFTLSTGSTNKNIREHAKEVRDALEKRINTPDHTITSK